MFLKIEQGWVYAATFHCIPFLGVLLVHKRLTCFFLQKCEDGRIIAIYSTPADLHSKGLLFLNILILKIDMFEWTVGVIYS